MRKIMAPYLNPALLAVSFLFSGCAYHSYFQSPFHATAEPYHSIPLQSDSLKSATYVSGVFTEGGANARIRDNVFSFTGSFYRSHNFGHFQGFYGANIALGSYSIKNFPGARGYSPQMDILPPTVTTGNKFFGGYGASGGIDFVLPFGRGSEWRVAGLSFTLQKEFGDYRRFRKALPDTLADAIFENDLVGILGLSTELGFKTRHGMIGYKLMLAGDIINGQDHYKGYDSSQFGMIFFQQSLSFTHDRFTGSFQFNVGNHVVNTQLGVGYRLERRKHSANQYAVY